MATTPEGIELVRAPYNDVQSLHKSDALRAVELPIAKAVELDVLYDYSAASVALTQKEISVSGMSPADLEAYLSENRDAIVHFALRCAQTRDDSDLGDGRRIGLANGFGISHAILHNFLANRSKKELTAFFKNRRIPTSEAKRLRVIFDALDEKDWQPPPSARGGLPIANEDLRDLFEHLDQESIAGYKCDHRFTLATKFLQNRNLPLEEMIDWLGENGAGCDCEIMFNVAETWESIVGYVPPD